MALRPYKVPSFEDFAGKVVANSGQSVPLARIGANAGVEGVGWETLRRTGQGMIAAGLQSQAEEAAREATIKGEAGAEDLFKGGDKPAPLVLRNDGTIAGDAYDKALMTGYLARVDLSAVRLLQNLQQEHPDDPEAFKNKWFDAGSQWVASLPPEMAANARLKWEEMGAKTYSQVNAQHHLKLLGNANADLMRGQDNYLSQAANAWRANDPNAAAEASVKWNQALDARTDLNPQQKEKARLDFQDEGRRQAVLGHFDQAKAKGLDAAERFIKSFTKPDAHAEIHPDLRDKIGHEMSRDLAELKAQRSVAISEIDRDFRQAADLAAKGYGTSYLDQVAQRAGAVDPKLAASINAQRNHFVELNRLTASAPEQQMAELARLKSEADKPGDLKTKALAVQKFETAVTAVGTAQKALVAEPLQHAVRQGVVKAELAPLGNLLAPDDQALKARASAARQTEEFYKIQGVSPVTNTEAGQMVRQVMAQKPEAMADAMQSLASRYGAWWPRVYAQMVDAKLPGQYRVLATVEDPVARLRLGEAYQLGEKNLKAAVADKAGDIDKQIKNSATLDQLRQTLAHTPDGAAIVADYAQASQLLAYRYAQSADASQASEQAVRDLVAAKYDFMIDDRHQARAPAGQGDVVRRHAGQILANLTADRLAVLPARPGETLTPEQRRQRYFDSALAGRWANNESDDGWQLLDETGLPVLGKDGRRIEFPYSAAGVVAR